MKYTGRMYRVFTGTKTDIVEHQANTKKEAIALSRNAVREAKERGLKDYEVVLFEHDKHGKAIPSEAFGEWRELLKQLL
jgi:hypothetical protein